MMYARNVRFEIQPGKVKDFNTTFNNDILPILKKQDGFRDEMLLVRETKGMGISLWNTREQIEKYQTTVYPEISKKLTPFLTGQPTIEVFELTSGTIHQN